MLTKLNHSGTKEDRSIIKRTSLTAGAARNNIMPQVEALFSNLSEIMPAKIPPERETLQCKNFMHQT